MLFSICSTTFASLITLSPITFGKSKVLQASQIWVVGSVAAITSGYTNGAMDRGGGVIEADNWLPEPGRNQRGSRHHNKVCVMGITCRRKRLICIILFYWLLPFMYKEVVEMMNLFILFTLMCSMLHVMRRREQICLLLCRTGSPYSSAVDDSRDDIDDSDADSTIFMSSVKKIWFPEF